MTTHDTALRTAIEDLETQIARLLEFGEPALITKAATLLNDLRLEFEEGEEHVEGQALSWETILDRNIDWYLDKQA